MERTSKKLTLHPICFASVKLGMIFVAIVSGFFISGQHVQKLKSSAELAQNFAAPPKALQHFLFGFQIATADVFWIRSLQDFDYCQRSGQQNKCKQTGWLFNMLDVITELDPQFRIAYAAGGLALTVIISDIAGASRLFDKGVAQFPRDWPILYRAAYHALYEEQDNLKAARLLEQAGRSGAPAWVFNLAGRLYSQNGQRELAERMLAELDTSNFDEVTKERMRQRFQEKIQSLPSK